MIIIHKLINLVVSIGNAIPWCFTLWKQKMQGAYPVFHGVFHGFPIEFWLKKWMFLWLHFSTKRLFSGIHLWRLPVFADWPISALKNRAVWGRSNLCAVDSGSLDLGSWLAHIAAGCCWATSWWYMVIQLNQKYVYKHIEFLVWWFYPVEKYGKHMGPFRIIKWMEDDGRTMKNIYQSLMLTYDF